MGGGGIDTDRHRERAAPAGRFDAAIPYFTEAAETYRALGRPHGEGTAHSNLGTALRQLERFEESAEAFQTAIHIYGETGDRDGEASALDHLGLTFAAMRRPSDAVKVHRTAARIHHATSAPRSRRAA